MKTMKYITTILAVLAFNGSFAQDNCSTYYPFEEGTTFQITNYDRKDKTTGVLDYKVVDVNSTDDGKTATIEMRVTDKKGEEVMDNDFNVTCANGVTSIDFKSLMPANMTEQYAEMETEITGTNLEIPNNLSVGQQLPDASMEMKINMGVMKMNMNLHITDRNVIAKEQVTTSAGTFDCYVITYNSMVKMGMKNEFSGKQWIAEGVGMVKQEDYNKKGKLTGKSVLTAFSK